LVEPSSCFDSSEVEKAAEGHTDEVAHPFWGSTREEAHGDGSSTVAVTIRVERGIGARS
jgi:hypothetical protein